MKIPQAMTQAKSGMAIGLALLGLLISPPSPAADLTLADGVVVKFGSDTQLVVRDTLSAGKSVVLTSLKDDRTAGPASATPQTPASGDWQGVRAERSATLAINETSFRYAGGQGGAALHLRGAAPSEINYLQITDSVIGLRLVDGVALQLDGGSFLRNGVALDVGGHSSPVVTNSQFAQNATQAILNRTPETLVLATGNWWGDASGPTDPVGNPQGKGDAVSTGVNYGNWLSASRLINPSLRLATPMSFSESSTVALLLNCVNATEYRFSEDSTFATGDFVPMAGQTTISLSPGDGLKQLYVQYRDAAGLLAVASLAGGLRVDSQGPTLAITRPVADSVVKRTTSVEGSASDPAGVAKVEFYVNDALQAARTAAPYAFSWNTEPWPEGAYTLKLVAVDTVGHSSTQLQNVTVSHAPDLVGPLVTGIRFGATALTDGLVLTANGTLTLDASDESGVARIDFVVDDQVVGSVASPSSGATYSGPLSLDALTNGPHTLAIRAYDLLNNLSAQSFSVSVAVPPPAAPAFTAPTANTRTNQSAVTVKGSTAQATEVRLTLNGALATDWLPVTAGLFQTPLTLAEGSNRISVTGRNLHGESLPSADLILLLDTAKPASLAGLAAVALDRGRIKLSWAAPSDPAILAVDLYRSTQAFDLPTQATKIGSVARSVTSFEDLPPADGSYAYRLVSRNDLGTLGTPSNLANAAADNTAPAAVAIAYTPTGSYDPTSQRTGQGRVNLLLTVSEPLSLVPYLSVVPVGTTPIPVDLVKQDDTHYAGSFLIDATTGSGTANILFSARDIVGNRGTVIQSGATLAIDAEGPTLTAIVLTPAAPIKADSTRDLDATFSFDQPIKPDTTPNLSYLLSGPVRSAVGITSLSQLDATTWRGSFTLPSDAGLGSGETLSFTVSALDDLDNVSTKITAGNRFEVYQGALPPLAVPLSFKAIAQPGGKVKLTWAAVDNAGAYQIYRQAPGESALTAWQRAGGLEFIDTTPADGAYTYSVASIRGANAQESFSAQATPVQVIASATAPGAPQNLALALTGIGLRATWQPPLGGTAPASYRLYRANAASITSLDGLTPIKTGIKTTEAIDAAPSPSEHAYVVTALDGAGNESALSNSAYLNASLLPVKTLSVEQSDSGQPLIAWTANGSGAVGFDLFVDGSSGPGGRIKLNTSLITGASFTDTGYAGGERRYTVEAVDANATRIGRSLTLPNVATQILAGLPLKRGVMNRVQVQVANLSASPIGSAAVVVRAGAYEHRSSDLSLGANETQIVPVIVGGYHDLSNPVPLTVRFETTPNEGELTRIARSQSADVGDSLLVVSLAPENFIRGSTGSVRLAVENTSDVEVELLTAQNSGRDASNELRLKLLDPDNNVLGVTAFKQAFGLGVVTLANGQTVARIAPGESFTSDPFSLIVPGASPNQITVRLEVDKLRYHTGQSDAIAIRGTGNDKPVSLNETPYFGEISSVSPLSSFGDRDITITGRAIERAGGTPLGNASLKLILNQQGFERSIALLTDAQGSFTHLFKPTATDAGLYRIAALHPDLTDRPVQAQFTINRVGISPDIANFTVPRNYDYRIDARALSGAGTQASNLRLAYEAQYQPGGVLPPGIKVILPAPIAIGANQNLALPITVAGDNLAAASGSFVLKAFSSETGSEPFDSLTVNYTLTEPLPVLTFSPTLVNTGLARGATEIESVVLANQGYAPLNDLTVALSKPDGSAPPEWVSLASQAQLGSLAVGETRSVDLRFTPDDTVPEGIHEFRLRITSSSLAERLINVYVAVTQSGQGSVLFKASDIYTATRDANGALIPGLVGARITLQNEQVATATYALTTDSLGEALFADIPAGAYRFKATAGNHQELGGRVTIKPGVTQNQPVFLDYTLISVEWSVREITIQDRYEITLNATFETNVPAPVVVLEPSSVNLPLMKAGDVWYGELTLSNYGLIRADNVKQRLPQSDAFFRYEFLASFPEQLAAKQRVTIPYRIVALQSLDPGAGTSSGTASGGGCYSYSNSTAASCSYTCANGAESNNCGSSMSWFASSNSTCTGSGGGGGGWGGGGGGTSSTTVFSGVGGSTSGSFTPSYTSMPGMPACVKCGNGCCAGGGGSGGAE